MAILPIAAEVAGLEPVKAANIEHAITELMAKPPGSRPTHTCAASSKSWLALERPKIEPIKTKSGMASNPKSFSEANTKSAKKANSAGVRKMRMESIAVRPSAKATGMPIASVKSNIKATMAPIVKALTDSDLLRDPHYHPPGRRRFLSAERSGPL